MSNDNHAVGYRKVKVIFSIQWRKLHVRKACIANQDKNPCLVWKVIHCWSVVYRKVKVIFVYSLEEIARQEGVHCQPE